MRIRKKMLWMIGITFLICLISSSAYAEDNNLSLNVSKESVPTTTFSPGEEGLLQVRLEKDSPLGGIELKLKYDDKRLEILDATTDLDSVHVDTIPRTVCTTYLNLEAKNKAFSKDTNLLTVKFKVKDDVEQFARFQLSVANLVQYDGSGLTQIPVTVPKLIKLDITSAGNVKPPVIPNPDIDENKPQNNVPSLDRNNTNEYITGYPGGIFLPNNQLTRAEAVVLFSRLITEKIEPGKVYTTGFRDIKPNSWYANTVGFMEKFGIVKGYPDGTFRPNASVSRAEFAAMAARFEKTSTEYITEYSDVPKTHWAAGSIAVLSEKGYLGGYKDHTFRPNLNITRAETVCVINRMLHRSISEDYIEHHISEMNLYQDVPKGYWAFKDIVSASNKIVKQV